MKADEILKRVRKGDVFYYVLPEHNCKLADGKMFFGVRLLNKNNLRRYTNLTGDCTGVVGSYDGRIYGDCTNITGSIYGLYGDVSGLSGDVTKVTGCCTGIVMDCTGMSGDIILAYNRKKFLEKFEKDGIFCSRQRFLTEEDNIKLWDVWKKLAYSTIGLTGEEYDNIEYPVKNKTPFPVDKWGRCYMPSEDGIRVFSINPVDIMLLRTNQEIQSCWSLYDKANGHLGMRLLIALNAINPTVGCTFIIKKIDKFNIFNGLSFRYYKHDKGTFFQYNENGIVPFGQTYCDLTPFVPVVRDSIYPSIYGHDGYNNLGHARQGNILFYEKFIKKDFSYAKDVDVEEGQHLLSNYNGYVLLNSDFEIIKNTLDDWDKDYLDDCIKSFKILHARGVYDEKI